MHTGIKERAALARTKTSTFSGVCAGTTIMTLKGEMLVEQLKAGDRIITRDSGSAILRDVATRTVNMQTIRIKAGSLGHTRPDRDMVVAPHAQLHIRDWRADALFGTAKAMIEAHRLIDGEFLSQQDAAETVMIDLIFDRQHIVYADGIELASAAV